MHYFILFLGVVVLTHFNYPAYSQERVDFSGVDQFRKMVDRWSQNEKASELNWTALFETPGYRYLQDTEGKGEFFRRYFPLIFRPDQREALKAELNRLEGYDKMIVEHYQNREEAYHFSKQARRIVRDLEEQYLRE